MEGETLTIKEKTLSVPKHDKGAIVLRFAPIDAPKEETILVKLEESSTGIQHTVKAWPYHTLDRPSPLRKR